MSFAFVAADLTARRAAGLYRHRHLVEEAEPGRLRLDGRWYLNFSSNDYLGLAYSPELQSVAESCARQHPSGSGASPLVTGHLQAHTQLEDYLAQQLGRDRVLLFSSGFAANQAVIQTLMRHGGRILADKLSHASMLDAAQHGPARLQRFRHNDAGHLGQLLDKTKDDCLVMTEGVFSMDGDQAPLAKMVTRVNDAGALMLLDDAHGFGVLGNTGLGTVQAMGLDQSRVPLLMATFGKAVGTSGAFVALNETLYEYLLNFGRHYIYSTAISPLMAALTLKSLQLIETQGWRRQRLQDNIQLFRRLANQAGLPLMESQTAIQPLLVGSVTRTVQLAEYARQQGVWLTAIRPPTVPPGSSRLRITVTAAHEQAQIKALVKVLAGGYALGQ